jgi:glycosyltransferase involved in cell wall biosynthesis
MESPNVLIIHTESVYFSGAQKMLLHFLGASSASMNVTLISAPNEKLDHLTPRSCARIEIPANQPFRLPLLQKQMNQITGFVADHPNVVLHGWAARDWELTSLVSKTCGVPAVGTLHDHPSANFISTPRRLIMKYCSRFGLQRTVCVSNALMTECVKAGYRSEDLELIYNGLPASSEQKQNNIHQPFTFGFLGGFSRRKGIQLAVEMIDELAQITKADWKFLIAGNPADEEQRQNMQLLLTRMTHSKWKDRIELVGWVDEPSLLIQKCDLVLLPSPEFDPFPTVMLESAQLGLPVVATDVGGIPEFVKHGKNGWTFPPEMWAARSARVIKEMIDDPERLRKVSRAAEQIQLSRFSTDCMLKNYTRLYEEVSTISHR